MLLRLSTLATGRTGVRAETAAGATPTCSTPGSRPSCREYGSLGCSGDLAPLAHCALALMGEGEVRDADGAPAARRPRRSPPPGSRRSTLAEKEGLALINGTDGMLGMLVLAIADLRRAAAHRRHRRGDERRGAARHRPRLRRRPAGRCARIPARPLARANMRAPARRLRSRRVAPRPRRNRVQDAYSLRCAPQVHGAVRDTIDHARLVADRELASAIDNPVVAADGRVESNGNFHGAPVGLRARLPRDRGRPTSPRSASAAPTASSTRPAPTGCRRSSPTTPASTAA